MPLLSWKPEYSVHEAELDSHHQKLFHLLNSAYENVMNSLEVDCVIPIIDELTQYIKYQLSAEEQYLREKEYNGIDAHIEKHREFTHTIESLKSKYHGNNLEVTQELIIVLGNWLLKHVITEHRKYSELSPANLEQIPVSSMSSCRSADFED